MPSWFRAARIAAVGTSALITRTLGAPGSCDSWASRSSSGAPVSRFAPGATVIMFSPAWSTVIIAIPVGTPAATRTPVSSTPSARSACRSAAPNSSSPTQPTIAMVMPAAPPSRAAATAWLAPLPPGAKTAAPPSTVAPGPGSAGTVTAMSMFRLPSTVSRATLATIAPYSAHDTREGAEAAPVPARLRNSRSCRK